jgi:hypothetical protein
VGLDLYKRIKIEVAFVTHFVTQSSTKPTRSKLERRQLAKTPVRNPDGKLGYKTIELFALQPSTGVGEVGRSPKIVILATGLTVACQI